MIIIDSDNYGEHGIETMFFPGGEPHVKVPAFTEDALFVARCRTWSDTGFAALVADALSRQGLTRTRVEVFLPYAPGARQDRSNGSCGLTAYLIGQMFSGDYQLSVFDIHSHAAAGVYDWPAQWDLTALDIPIRANVTGIIAPDEGAVGRATAFRDKFYPGVEVIKCSKERDPQTGALSHYQLPSLPSGICGGHMIVVDDICDGGGTFNLLAAAFNHRPLTFNGTLELIVSHGIFSKGLDAISPLYQYITTTDSWCRLPSSERLTVLPLEQLYNRIMGELRA